MNSAMQTRRNVVITLTGVLLIGDAAAQLRARQPAAMLNSGGPKPTLIAPAANAQIDSSPSRREPVLFRWQLPSGAPAPRRYMICIAETGASCNSSGTRTMLEPVPVTGNPNTGQYQTLITAALHDKALEWTVGACGPEYTPSISVAGASNADCTWSDRRKLNVGYQPPAIQLSTPGDSVTASTASQRFTWQEPRGTSVDGYRLCLAANVNACRQSSLAASQGALVPVPQGRAFGNIDLRPLRQNQPRQMIWTVLSCRNGNCSLAANQQTRRFVIPAPPPPPALQAPAANSIEPVKGATQFPLGATVNSSFSGPRNYPATIDFKWSPATGVARHKLCLSPPGVACGSGASHVVDARYLDSESLEWEGLAPLHGQAVNWTAASCDALGCGAWAAPRPMTIKAVPGQVTLSAPADGTDLSTHPAHIPFNLTWSTAAFAEQYVIILGSQTNTGLRVGSNHCRTYRAGFPAGATEWRVQACNTVGCGPASAPWDITFNPVPRTASSRRTTRGGSGPSVGVASAGPRCR